MIKQKSKESSNLLVQISEGLKQITMFEVISIRMMLLEKVWRKETIANKIELHIQGWIIYVT